jgi:hypothetical protein
LSAMTVTIAASPHAFYSICEVLTMLANTGWG